jgi:prevent-host-death family protein
MWIASQNTQSLTDFRQSASETLNRVNRTGEAEIITVNGSARAVILSPSAYDRLAREALLARDAKAIKRSMKEIDEGSGTEAGTFFDSLRSDLMKKKRGRARSR